MYAYFLKYRFVEINKLGTTGQL